MIDSIKTISLYDFISSLQNHPESNSGTTAGRVLVNSQQALILALFAQRSLDRKNGRNTAGLVSGYRGSPLAGFDKLLQTNEQFLNNHNIAFKPGLNEDLAATILWGTQQTELSDKRKQDGVFGLWYGKGPGVDRSGDALRHANLAGTAPCGGVLMVVGDDHAAQSSSAAHQCEFSMMDAQIPLLHPSSVQEVLDLAITGWSLSRASGCWCALKLTTEIAETTAAVEFNLSRYDDLLRFEQETRQSFPDTAIRWPDTPQVQEKRLRTSKMAATGLFLEKLVSSRLSSLKTSGKTRPLVITTGKLSGDLNESLQPWKSRNEKATDIDHLSLPTIWPLPERALRQTLRGRKRILVLEEKRPVLERALRDLLYDLPERERPELCGKQTHRGQPLVPDFGTLDSDQVRLIVQHWQDRQCTAPLHLGQDLTVPARLPHFCAGCPHNASTTVPEGSRALAGIGCHYMAMWMDRKTETFSHMGAEGVSWIGQEDYINDNHVFVNLGDGTYTHSGSLAIRAAVAAGSTMTYKILFNDAVAMTGGQQVEGAITARDIVRQVAAERVASVALLCENPERYRSFRQQYHMDASLPPLSIAPLEKLDQIQQNLARTGGVTVLIYEKTCATEAERRKKKHPESIRKNEALIQIDPDICDNCGDCTRLSNCTAIEPVETSLGRKRQISPSACVQDSLCLQASCPSFFSVRKPPGKTPDKTQLPPLPPPPRLPAIHEEWNLLLSGLGGRGITSLSRLLALAATYDNRSVTTLEMAGLAQKHGAVTCHLRLFEKDQLHSRPARIPAAQADLLLAGELRVASSPDILKILSPSSSHVVLNTETVATGDFLKNPDAPLPGLAEKTALQLSLESPGQLCDDDFAKRARAYGMSSRHIMIFMLGFSWQKALVPLSCGAIERAIEKLWEPQGAGENLRAFHAGTIEAAKGNSPRKKKQSLSDLEQRIEAELRAHDGLWQKDKALPLFVKSQKELARWLETDNRKTLSEQQKTNLLLGLMQLLAPKDIYDIARRYADPAFLSRNGLDRTASITLHLASPLALFGKHRSGERPVKKAWPLRRIRPFLALLAKGRHIRGLWCDPFRLCHEYKLQHSFKTEALGTLERLCRIPVNPQSIALLERLADTFRTPRGYGAVRLEGLEKALHELSAINLALQSLPGEEQARSQKRGKHSSRATGSMRQA